MLIVETRLQPVAIQILFVNQQSGQLPKRNQIGSFQGIDCYFSENKEITDIVGFDC